MDFLPIEKSTNVLGNLGGGRTRVNPDYSQMDVFIANMVNYIFSEKERHHLSKNI